MALSDMEVFNEFFMPSIIETVGQQIQQFNAASGGAIRLSAEGFTGDFSQSSFYDTLAAARRRVDRYAANGAQAATDLTQSKISSVKVAGGFGPIRYEPSQMTWLRKPTAEGIEMASRAFADLLLQDQLNTGIAAAVAAIGNNAAVVNDVSATANITYAAINGSHAKFKDASGSLVTDVMDGATFHRLIGQNLANVATLFLAGNVTIVSILNKLTIVTDAPALLDVVPVPDESKVLSLAAGAVTIDNVTDIVTAIVDITGNERIQTHYQTDYTFGVALKGYTWDETNGGKSPLDAEIATGSNWDKVVSDDKFTAGTMAIGDPLA